MNSLTFNKTNNKTLHQFIFVYPGVLAP